MSTSTESIAQCHGCGKLIPATLPPLCAACGMNANNRASVVKAYVADREGATVADIHTGTGIAIDEIWSLMHSGMLVQGTGAGTEHSTRPASTDR